MSNCAVRTCYLSLSSPESLPSFPRRFPSGVSVDPGATNAQKWLWWRRNGARRAAWPLVVTAQIEPVLVQPSQTPGATIVAHGSHAQPSLSIATSVSAD